LLLTESAGERVFEDLANLGEGRIGEDWAVERCEDISLTLRRVDGQELVLVAGCQIETAERLEVLALFTRHRVEDGLTLQDSLQRTVAAGGIPVLPWGFGKWWFRRGQILRHFVAQHTRSKFFLGDNSGRPWFFLRSPIFRLAESKGIVTLPGSDPLPLDGHADHAASYGFVLEASIDPEHPAASAKAAILSMSEDPASFGRRAGFWDSLTTQLAMQRRRRFGAASAIRSRL
jgi:hypothetical protein